MEKLRRFLTLKTGHPPREESSGREESKEWQTPHGWIALGENWATAETTDVSRSIIHAGGKYDHVWADVADVAGIIRTEFGDVDLTINPAVQGTKPVTQEDQSEPQEIGRMAHDKRWKRESLEENLQDRRRALTNLNEELARLSDDPESAQEAYRAKLLRTPDLSEYDKLIARDYDVEMARMSSAEQIKGLESQIKGHDKANTPSADSLHIRSHSGNITLTIEDLSSQREIAAGNGDPDEQEPEVVVESLIGHMTVNVKDRRTNVEILGYYEGKDLRVTGQSPDPEETKKTIRVHTPAIGGTTINFLTPEAEEPTP